MFALTITFFTRACTCVRQCGLDRDECANLNSLNLKRNWCGGSSVCVNGANTFWCLCAPGWQLDPKSPLKDKTKCISKRGLRAVRLRMGLRMSGRPTLPSIHLFRIYSAHTYLSHTHMPSHSHSHQRSTSALFWTGAEVVAAGPTQCAVTGTTSSPARVGRGGREAVSTKPANVRVGRCVPGYAVRNGSDASCVHASRGHTVNLVRIHMHTHAHTCTRPPSQRSAAPRPPAPPRASASLATRLGTPPTTTPPADGPRLALVIGAGGDAAHSSHRQRMALGARKSTFPSHPPLLPSPHPPAISTLVHVYHSGNQCHCRHHPQTSTSVRGWCVGAPPRAPTPTTVSAVSAPPGGRGRATTRFANEVRSCRGPTGMSARGWCAGGNRCVWMVTASTGASVRRGGEEAATTPCAKVSGHLLVRW